MWTLLPTKGGRFGRAYLGPIMKLPKVSRALFAGALVVFVAACSNGPSTSSGAATSSAAPAGSAQVIKIGVDLPVSGADAAIGVPTQNGAVLAIEQADKHGFAGGAFKLEASLLDDAVQGVHDPAAGAQNVKTFIADSAVLAMVGPFNSNVAKSEIPLTNDAGLAQISPSNTNDGLTVGDDAKKLRTAHPDTNTYFRVCTSDSRQGGALAQFAKKLGFKKVFIVDDNETYGKGLADNFESCVQGAGRNGSRSRAPHRQPTRLQGAADQGQSTAPDAVFFGGNDVDRRRAVAPPDGRRRHGARRRSSAVTASATRPSSSKKPARWRNNVYYSFAAPDADKLPSAKAFVARLQGALSTADVGPYSASAVRGDADHHRGDRESDQG